MALLDLKDKRNKAFVDVLLQKTKTPATKVKTSVRSGGSLIEKIKNIETMVQSKLGHYKDELMLIQTEQELSEYIDKAISNGVIAIDTETTGLDPFTCHIVGVCLYTPGMNSAYIPMYHTSYISRQRIPNQLDNEVVARQLQRLIDHNVNTIFFNAKFDIRMMRQSLGIYMTPYWDGFIAAKCLKENEEEASLKYLWKKYCSPDKDAAHFTFDKFFKGIQFDLIPIHTAYLYAAMDTKMTYELYKFQEPYLTETDEKCIALDMTRLAKLYREIEMPIITVTADIEDRGVIIDKEFAANLSDTYHKMMDEQLEKFYAELSKYQDQITSYLSSHPQTKLEDPINIGSPTQLAELFYDVLKITPPDKRNPRGTGVDILKAMKHPLCDLILDYRGTQKLLSTYIDKLPEAVNAKTQKLHAAFKQYGTDTGRYASADPNLQNIPSHTKEIRLMFLSSRYIDLKIDNGSLSVLWGDVIKTSTGKKFVQDLKYGDIISVDGKQISINNIEIVDEWNYNLHLEGDITCPIRVNRLYIMVGADYSQQEPKLTADLSNDEKFIAECAAGKDAYGTVASLAFNKPYEDCLEFYLDENGNKTDKINKEGKERRTQSKSILLGITYGRTIKTIAEQLGCPEEKAQQIYNSVLNGIAGLRMLTEESEDMARRLGYVETKWGRRRHIPDMQLEPFEVVFNGTKNFDPFFDSEQLGVIDDGERLRLDYIKQLKEAKYKQQRDSIKMKAEKDGFKVHEHTRKIEDAKRQCVNCVDDKTEILTQEGWKTVYDLKETDSVYTVNLETQKGEWNQLIAINKYEGDFEVYKFEHPNFTCLSTPDHRWVCQRNKKGSPLIFKTTEQLTVCGENWENKPILRSVATSQPDGPYEDWWLMLVGWFLTDGSIGEYNSIHIYQDKKSHPQNCDIIESILKEGNVVFSTRNRNDYITWTIAYEVGAKIKSMFPNRTLTPQFIQTLSERQCKIILEQMVLADGTKSNSSDISIVCGTKDKSEMLQMLCQMAGIATTVTEVNNIGKVCKSDKLSNDICIKNLYYNVRLLKRNKIHLYSKHISKDKLNFVWCPTTKNGTWLARRGRNTFITGNSRIQGSAADQTKIAMRLIAENKELKDLDFHMILLVHDEIIGECPIVNIAKAEPIFVQCMLNAAKDLRTGAKCDATCVLAWYDDQFDREIHPEELTKEKLTEIIKGAKYIWD